MITPERAPKAIEAKLGVHLSSYFSRRREQYFFDYVKDQLFQQYGAQTVREGGMKVYTTIDLDKQEQARDAIADHLAGIGPSSAIVTLNPKNGYIEAMASSGDYGQSNFNLAAQGHRQPGSTFKVMALMTALRMGVDPDSTHYMSVSPTDRQRPAVRRRSRSRPTAAPAAATMSLRQATLKSDNSVYIQLAMDLGPEKVKKTARDDGHHVDAQRLSGGDARRPRERRLAARDGRRLRDDRLRRLPQPADRDQEDHASPTASRDGQALPKRFRVKRTKVFSDGVDRRGHARSSSRTSRAAPGRTPRSAARRAARPARPTTTPTPGSSASRRA